MINLTTAYATECTVAGTLKSCRVDWEAHHGENERSRVQASIGLSHLKRDFLPTFLPTLPPRSPPT